MSETQPERKIYDTASRDEDAFLVDHLRRSWPTCSYPAMSY